MPKFTYVSRDIQGQRVTAVAEAQTKRDLLVSLKERGLTAVEVYELVTSTKTSKPSKKKASSRLLSFGRRISSGELVIFWRQFATMITAGLPIIEALESIAQEHDNKELERALNDLIAGLWEGLNFSESMRRHSRLFSPMVVALIGAAEESGSLSVVANHLANYLESRDRVVNKARAALTYPIFVCVFFVGVLVFAAFWIVPNFRDIYDGFHAKLPPLTQFVFAIDSAFLKYFPWIFATVAALAMALGAWVRTPKARTAVDRLSFRLPVLGKLLQRATVARLCRSLGVLLSGGVPINRALEMAEGTSGNSIVDSSIRQVREEILKGGKIAASMRKQPVFPKMVIRMVSTGEETGNLPFLLEKTAEFYETRVDAALATLNALIEPIIIVIVGFFVLIFVLAIYMPIFTLGQNMKM